MGIHVPSNVPMESTPFKGMEFEADEIAYGFCVGQFCPVFKLCVRKPGPILSPFIQIEPGRARPNIQGEGKRISEDSQPRNEQNYHPRRGGACL